VSGGSQRSPVPRGTSKVRAVIGGQDLRAIARAIPISWSVATDATHQATQWGRRPQRFERMDSLPRPMRVVLLRRAI